MTRPEPRYKPGDRIGGRYQVHQVKMGGMGEVYLCLDLEEMVPYALKTFQQRYQSAALRKAFEQEVTTWVALEKHPNIVRCKWMQIFDNQPFMGLEWIAGEEGKGADLRGWLRRGPLELRTALDIIIHIVRGLLHAQEKQPGLVHRDLKPENILMAQGPIAKITDFGLAQIVENAGLEVECEADERQSMVGKGGIAGTPAYMAPEQWRGGPLDERTDIYAVGCILYEMLVGRAPFWVDFTPTMSHKQWLNAIRSRHENTPTPALRTEIPGTVDEVVRDSLAKVPSDRPIGLAILSEQLDELYEQQFNQPPPIRPASGEMTVTDYSNRGLTYDNLKQYEMALADFNRAIQLDPQEARVYSNRGNTYSKLGKTNKALRDFSQAIDLNPLYANAYSNRGLTYKDLGQMDKALADFNRAIDLDPRFASFYFNRGLTYDDLGQVEIAIADFNQAIHLDRQLAQAYEGRGTAYYKLGQVDHAIADYTYAIELEPLLAKSFSNRGAIYARLGETDKAIADFTRAININPQLAEVYFNRGNIYKNIGHAEKAIADYTRVIEINPKLPQTYVKRADVYESLGQVDCAIADYTYATELAPYYTEAYFSRGNIYRDIGYADKAIADYTHAIELEPQLAWSYYNRGLTYATLGQTDKAIADYNLAIKFDPKFAQAYYNRGNLYKNVGQANRAIADYTRAIELDPEFAQAHFNLGASLANAGKLRESLPYFHNALRLGFSQAHQAITQVRQALGELAPTTQVDPTQHAVEAFRETDTREAMRQAVTRYPILKELQFIAAIEEAITQQVPPEQRPYFEQRLAWLRQIAQEQP